MMARWLKNSKNQCKRIRLKCGAHAFALVVVSGILMTTLAGCGNSDKTVAPEDSEIETSTISGSNTDESLQDYEEIGEISSNDDENSAAEIGNYVDISSIDDMEEFSSNVAKGKTYSGYTIRLTNDLQYDGIPDNFTPIGSFENYFEGTFDGQNHTISGIYLLARPDGNNALFNVLQNATLKNLILKDCKVVGNANDVNMIATYSRSSTLENVHIVGGEVKNTFSTAAAFFASADDSLIRNCSNTAPVTGCSWTFIAGLVGTITKTNIINCFNGGDVISTEVERGQQNTTAGICYSGSGSIINCYNTGKATYGITAQASNVVNCYSAKEQSEDYFGNGDIVDSCEILSLSEMCSQDFLNKLNDYASRNDEFMSFSYESGYDYPVIR